MNAMPTEYKGITFRSKLEAQVAVLLDGLKADWAYEPECFELENGEKYLPDFVIYNNKGRGSRTLFVEVKGVFNQGRDDEDKVWKFCCPTEELRIQNSVLIVDRILEGESIMALMDAAAEIHETPARGAKYLCPFSTETVDGDAWGCFPITDGEHFILEDINLNRQNEYNYTRANFYTPLAYQAARNAFAYKPPQHTRRFYKGAPYEFKGGRWQRVLNGDEWKKGFQR